MDIVKQKIIIIIFVYKYMFIYIYRTYSYIHIYIYRTYRHSLESELKFNILNLTIITIVCILLFFN